MYCRLALIVTHSTAIICHSKGLSLNRSPAPDVINRGQGSGLMAGGVGYGGTLGSMAGVQCIMGNGHSHMRTPPVDRHTHTGENITCPQLRWRAVNIREWHHDRSVPGYTHHICAPLKMVWMGILELVWMSYHEINYYNRL